MKDNLALISLVVAALALGCSAVTITQARVGAPKENREKWTNLENVNCKIIRAEKFELVGLKGNGQAWLGVSPHGFPFFQFNDHHGKIRFILKLNSDGQPELNLKDQHGVTRVNLMLGLGESPELSLFDPHGVTRVNLKSFGESPWFSLTGQDEKGNISLSVLKGVPGLLFTRKNREPIASLVEEDAGPLLTLYGQEKSGLTLSVTKDSTGLKLLDKSGKVRSALGLFPGGQQVLTFFDKDGKFRTLFGLNPDGLPGLDFYDKNGKVIRSLP